MNLEDLVDEKGLQQDEWSLTAPTFGDESQISVVGWSGKTKPWCGTKFYIVMCTNCSKDRRLFGSGHFRILKGDIIKGVIPCGCGKSPRWSKEQYETLCSRGAEGLGYKFLGFVGEWKGKTTKIEVLCEKHGVWDSGTIGSLLHGGNSCPACKCDVTAKRSLKPDETMVQSFFDSGAFHPDTKFWRSEKKNSSNRSIYWHFSCPDCGGQGESESNKIQAGQKSCGCSRMRQQEAYINFLVDVGGNVIAIKFGIANSSPKRAKKQNRQCSYEVTQHQVFTFHSVEACKTAERDCKQELDCGVVLKRDMPDGYTETTWAYNLEKIIEIYERNGGILKQDA